MPLSILTTLTLTLLTLGTRWAFVPAFLSWRHVATFRTNSTKEEWLAETHETVINETSCAESDARVGTHRVELRLSYRLSTPRVYKFECVTL